MYSTLASRTQVFLSYSHQDNDMMLELYRQLAPLQRLGLVEASG